MSLLCSVVALVATVEYQVTETQLKVEGITTDVTIVAPATKGRKPAVFYFHWLGQPNGNRDEFLAEAVSMARRGAVSLLIAGRTPWKVPFQDLETDKKNIRSQLGEVRRALAYLRGRSDVDAHEIVYVGHDYGAMYGSLLSAEETKLKGWVFVAGMGSFADWSLKYWPKTAAQGEAAYRDGIRELDPVGAIGKETGVPRLFQFAKKDEFISEAQANEFFEASSEPKRALWYDEEHELMSNKVRAERTKWVAERLGLRP